MTPRETVLRMLEHMHDDVSYEDIVRQLRILQDIENTLNDVDMGGFPADNAVEEARSELDAPADANEPALRPPSSTLILRSRSQAECQSISGRPAKASDALLRNAAWHP